MRTPTPSPAPPPPTWPITIERTPPTRLELMARGRKHYEVAKQLLDGPERPRFWRAAAEDYEAAFHDDPAGEDAPVAALNGAWAYREIGEYAKAIELYQLLIANYGSERVLVELQNADAQAEALLEPNPSRKRPAYGQRVAYTVAAYEALAAALAAVADYGRAAEILETASKNARFAETWRRNATQKAQELREMAPGPLQLQR